MLGPLEDKIPSQVRKADHSLAVHPTWDVGSPERNRVVMFGELPMIQGHTYKMERYWCGNARNYGYVP
jgi:hypothetical protein